MFFMHYLIVLSYVFSAIFTIWGFFMGATLVSLSSKELEIKYKWDYRTHRLATFSILLGIASFVYLVMGVICLF